MHQNNNIKPISYEGRRYIELLHTYEHRGEDSCKILWQWIKEGKINYRTFTEILEEVYKKDLG